MGGVLHTKHGRNEEILKRHVSLNPSFQTTETKDPKEWEISHGYFGRRKRTSQKRNLCLERDFTQLQQCIRLPHRKTPKPRE